MQGKASVSSRSNSSSPIIFPSLELRSKLAESDTRTAPCGLMQSMRIEPTTIQVFGSKKPARSRSLPDNGLWVEKVRPNSLGTHQGSESRCGYWKLSWQRDRGTAMRNNTQVLLLCNRRESFVYFRPQATSTAESQAADTTYIRTALPAILPHSKLVTNVAVGNKPGHWHVGEQEISAIETGRRAASIEVGAKLGRRIRRGGRHDVIRSAGFAGFASPAT
jgi:hypothetical protein